MRLTTITTLSPSGKTYRQQLQPPASLSAEVASVLASAEMVSLHSTCFPKPELGKPLYRNTEQHLNNLDSTLLATSRTNKLLNLLAINLNCKLLNLPAINLNSKPL